MNNLNKFTATVKQYVGRHEAEPEKNLVIDCRDHAIIGKMILNNPFTEDERDDCIASLIAALAELVSPDVAMPWNDVACHLAARIGEAVGEIYVMDEEADW